MSPLKKKRASTMVVNVGMMDSMRSNGLMLMLANPMTNAMNTAMVYCDTPKPGRNMMAAKAAMADNAKLANSFMAIKF